MGRLQAQEMIRWATKDKALEWHLSSNHYPSQTVWLKAARKALALARQGKFDAKVQLPPGVEDRDGGKFVSAGQVINHLHMEDFITQVEDEHNEEGD